MTDTGSLVSSGEDTFQEPPLWRLQRQLQPWQLNPPAPTPLPAPAVDPPTATAASMEPSPKRRFKWSTSLDDRPSLEQVLASHGPLPVATLLRIPWTPQPGHATVTSHIRTVHRSAHGSQGVFFVAFRQPDGLLVLKPPVHSLASEVVATILSQQVNIYTPLVHLVRTQSDEGTAMLDALRPVDANWQVLIRLYDQVWVMVKEYVQGWPLFDLREQQARAWFLSLDGAKEWTGQLGRLMALDVLLNNGDRLPLVWENQGNGGNVYLAAHRDPQSASNSLAYHVVNLDAGMRPIDPQLHAAAFEAYYRRVSSFLDELARHWKTRTPMPAFASVLRLLWHWVGQGREGVPEAQETRMTLWLMQGFVQCLWHQFDEAGCAALRERISTVCHLLESLDRESPAAIINLEALAPAYFDRMLKLYREKRQLLYLDASGY